MPLGSSKSCSSLHGPSLEPDALAAPGDDPGRELSDDEAQLVCVRAHSGAHSVRVVFYTSEGERAFILDSIEAMMWMSDTHQALVRWTRSFEDTGLRPGMYPFSFFVDGARLLSREHPVYGDTNFGLFNRRLCRYIRKCHRSCGLERHPSVFERAMSCGDEHDFQGPPRVARSRSMSNLAAAGADQDAEMTDARSDKGATLPDRVFAGLMGRSLALRLLGYAVPSAAIPAEAARGLRLRAGAHQITKPLAPQCEDAHFLGERALGVADGVGGMAQFKEYGVDSAKYAAGLMQSARSALRRHEEGSLDSFLSNSSPQAAAQLALAAVAAADGEAAAFGGATITVLTLLGARIGVANLGDSGFMVLRLGENGVFVVQRSVEQQHGFNFPFQLTNFPPELSQRFAQLQVDRASSCELYSCDVRVGDLVLLFTDGLTDNVYEREVLEIVGCALSPAMGDLLGLPGHATPPENIAKALADAAHLRSQDGRANVPFSDYSWRFGYDLPGGKEDDITVVAAWVVPDVCN